MKLHLRPIIILISTQSESCGNSEFAAADALAGYRRQLAIFVYSQPSRVLTISAPNENYSEVPLATTRNASGAILQQIMTRATRSTLHGALEGEIGVFNHRM